MKKIIDFLKNILLAIVYPSRLLDLFRVKNLDENSNKILGNDNIVKVVALMIAVVIIVATRYTPTTTRTHREVIPDIPLETNIDEDYTYFGSPIPQHVNVILSGDRAEILLLLATSEVSAYIDLTDLEPGQHDNVPISINGVNNEQITVTVDPSIVSGIEIDRIATRILPIEEVSRTNFPDLGIRYNYEEIITDPSEITVSGPQRILDEIDALRIPFDASNIAIEPGISFTDGLVIAHDSQLGEIRGVEFDPPTVQVRVEIYENLRTINIEINEELLNPPRGYEIIVTADIDEIQVWGDFSEMDSVLESPSFSLADLDDEGQITLQIELPAGVYTEIDETVVTVIEVEVTVEVEELPPPERRRNETDENETDDTSLWLNEKDEKRKIT